MIRRNHQGREIWFERWGCMPCHWKGWLLLLSIVTFANAGVWLLIWLLRAHGDDSRPFLVLPVAIIVGLVLADR